MEATIADSVRSSTKYTTQLWISRYENAHPYLKFLGYKAILRAHMSALALQLTQGGKGWTDDFAVRGPAPDTAPLSWDKSPVANGAHYFLFGRVDPSDPPGILREKGFGVEFPNYIVDV